MSSKDPTITVLLPTYNRPEMLKESLESLLVQDMPIQLVILNNGSTDDKTSIVIHDYLPRFHDAIHLHYQQNDLSNIKNLLPHATGDYIVEFTDDDRMLPGHLRALADALDHCPTAGFAFGPAYCIDVEGKRTGEVKGTCESHGFTFAEMLPTCKVCMPSVMMRREAARTFVVNPIDPGAEWARYLEILEDGWCSLYVPEAGIELRIHPGSDTNLRGFTGGFLDATLSTYMHWVFERNFNPSEKTWQEMFTVYANLAMGLHGVSGKFIDAMKQIMDLKIEVANETHM